MTRQQKPSKKTRRGRKRAPEELGDKILRILSAAAQTLDFFGEITYRSYPYLYNALGGVAAREEVDDALARLSRKGLVHFNGERQLRLTFAGAEVEQSLYRARHQDWDGQWRVVVFDIPEKYRDVRDDFRRLLKKLGFALWQRSVWISPFDVVTELNAYLAKNNLSPHVQIMVGKRVGKLDDREFAAHLWPLGEINQRYENFLESWGKELGRERSGEKRLVVVRKLYHYYLDILNDDPQLPPQLLPIDWQGGKSIALFKKLQSFLALDKG